MLVISKAPIVEEYSNLTTKEKRAQRKAKTRKVTDKLKGGYTRFKDAGGLPVIENLLGLSAAPAAELAQKTPVLGQEDLAAAQLPPQDDQGMGGKKGLSTGQKWAIGLGVAAVLGVVGYFVWKKYSGTSGKSGKAKPATVK